MPSLTNRLAKLEAQALGDSSKIDIVQATELAVRALQAMTESDFQAFQAGRFTDMSQAAQQAWAEHDLFCKYDAEQIALHRRRWQAAMPALIEAQRNAEEC